MRTIFPQEIEGAGASDTVWTQESAESNSAKVRFPKLIKYRGRVLVTIYGKSKSYPLYRVSWTAGGRRLMQAFRTYGEAKRHAGGKKTELAKGSAAAALTAGQARDALAAFERLQSFYQSTGRHVSLLAAVSEFAEAAGKLEGRTLSEAVNRGAKSCVRDTRALSLIRINSLGGRRSQVGTKTVNDGLTPVTFMLLYERLF